MPLTALEVQAQTQKIVNSLETVIVGKRRELELANRLNQRHRSRRGADGELAARIRAFETAFSMQTEARESFDVRGESQATLDLYGLQPGQNDGFGWQCLVSGFSFVYRRKEAAGADDPHAHHH